jgi:hypothetical protein
MYTTDLIKKELLKYKVEKPFIGKNAILDKETFYQLAADGLCGNTMRTWMSYSDWLDSTTHRYRADRYCIRSLYKNNSKCLSNVHVDSLKCTLNDNYIKEGTYIISEIPPKQPKVDIKNADMSFIQGEFTWFNGDYHLYYTNIEGYMREALKIAGRNTIGAECLFILQRVLNDTQYNALIDLLETYHDKVYGYPVIEFALSRKSCGRLNQNLIIWEVRHY